MERINRDLSFTLSWSVGLGYEYVVKTLLEQWPISLVNLYGAKLYLMDDGNDVSVRSIYPESDHLEEAFYNGSLLYNVHLEDTGLFALTVTMSEDGNIKVLSKEKYIGWVPVQI